MRPLPKEAMVGGGEMAGGMVELKQLQIDKEKAEKGGKVTMTMDELGKRTLEEHKLTLKILEVIEYGSLEDIISINKWLNNNSFNKRKATAIDNLKKDICTMADKLDTLQQATVNLKYLIGKNGKVV